MRYLVLSLLVLALAVPVLAQDAPAVSPPGAPPTAPPDDRPTMGAPPGSGGIRPSSPMMGGPRPANAAAPCVLPALGILQPRMTDMLATRLNLTDDQKSKLQSLLTRNEETSLPLLQDQQKAAKAFAEMLTAPTAAQAELSAAGDKVMKAEAAVLDARVKLLFEVRALLNDDQKAALNTMLERYTNVWRGSPSQPQPTQRPEPAK